MPIILAMSHANQEKVARFNIERQGYKAYVPMISTHRMTGPRGAKRRVISIRPLFPRYVFVDTPGPWYFLKGTFGVSSVVMLRSGPAELAPEILKELRSREDEDGYITLPDEASKELQPGDRVLITKGALANFPGLYAGMKDDDRVKVLLSIFGRQQEVVISRKDVAANRDE